MSIQNKPLIFISNDDGVQAKGIRELIEAVRPLGEIVVIAPDGPRSGMSGAITSETALRVKLITKEEGLTIYSCNGTPVDCVKLAFNEILDRKPDLLVSGINHGSNSAISVLYSGTMGVALEGCIYGVPSIGFSLTDHSHEADFSEAIKYVHLIASNVLLEGLPKGICLNVNIPDTKEIQGIKVCSQAEGRWTSEYMKSQDAAGRNVYWLTGSFENHNPDNQQTDEWALSQHYVSIVPCKIDMTAYEAMEQIKRWEFINEQLRVKN